VPEDVHLDQPNQKTRLRRCHLLGGEPTSQSDSLSSPFFWLSIPPFARLYFQKRDGRSDEQELVPAGPFTLAHYRVCSDAMKKRRLLLSVSLFCLSFTSAALAEEVEIGRVPMPVLSSSEWATIHQQQGPNSQIIPVDVNLAVNQGVVYGVNIRHGSGYPEIDQTIVRWIAENWRTDNWFRGGDAYVVSLNVDPVAHHVVFRNNDSSVRHNFPIIEKLRADVISIVRGS